MKFKYKPFFDLPESEGGSDVLPLLSVRLKNGRNELTVRCLVDSGASETLLSADIAELLGIDLTKAEEQSYIGIGETPIRGFSHKLMLKVSGFDEWIVVIAGFIPENEMPLLGHSGFFESYEVTFRAFYKSFEIKTPKKSAKPPEPPANQNLPA